MKKVKSKTRSDPFAISLAERLAASEEQQWALTQRLYQQYADANRGEV